MRYDLLPRVARAVTNFAGFNNTDAASGHRTRTTMYSVIKIPTYYKYLIAVFKISRRLNMYEFRET